MVLSNGEPISGRGGQGSEQAMLAKVMSMTLNPIFGAGLLSRLIASGYILNMSVVSSLLSISQAQFAGLASKLKHWPDAKKSCRSHPQGSLAWTPAAYLNHDTISSRTLFKALPIDSTVRLTLLSIVLTLLVEGLEIQSFSYHPALFLVTGPVFFLCLPYFSQSALRGGVVIRLAVSRFDWRPSFSSSSIEYRALSLALRLQVIAILQGLQGSQGKKASVKTFDC
eukprot:1153954-Pelagomonas_calceolata.AAC.5